MLLVYSLAKCSVKFNFAHLERILFVALMNSLEFCSNRRKILEEEEE